MARRGSSRRTYVRDANGRFASTPGGGGPKRPATKAVKRGPNRLTRDNAGKITSQGGDGATVRGGRLKTAAGNLRGRQVAKLKTMQGVSYGSKKPADGFRPGQTKRLKRMQGVSYGKSAPKAKSDAGSFRPGEFYRGNFRPRNVAGKFAKGKDPYQSGKGKTNAVISASNDDKKARLGNARTAQDFFESKGLKVKFSSNKRGSTIASYNLATKEISINRSHANWINPGSAARRNRAAGQFSSSSPMHVLYHELGHARDKSIRNRQGPFGEMWILATRQGSSDKKRAERATEMSKLSRRVSRYATTNPSEFIAETYAGRRTGRKYDYQVMDAYREARGLPQLRLKGQKPIRRKRKP